MAWLLGILIILFPILLSDLSDGPESARAKQAAPLVTAAPSKPGLQLNHASAVDRDAFLASFARQASSELVPCLKAQGERLGWISLLARLSKQGKLTSVRIVSPKTINKDCVIAASQNMTFAGVGSKLQKENVEIAWRFEW